MSAKESQADVLALSLVFSAVDLHRSWVVCALCQNRGEKSSYRELEQQIDERKQALSKPVVADIDSVQPVEKVDKKEPVVELKQHVHTGVTDYNYDARVRTGAYVIVGIDQVVTVQKGQTLASISKGFLGDGMECYVEVLTNVQR